MNSAESWSDLVERMHLGIIFNPDVLEKVRHVADASFANGKTEGANEHAAIMSAINRHSEALAKAMVE